MYTFEFCFYPKSFEVPFIDEFDNKMKYFISALLKNGQILTANQNTVKYQDHYAYRVISPEMDHRTSWYSSS